MNFEELNSAVNREGPIVLERLVARLTPELIQELKPFGKEIFSLAVAHNTGIVELSVLLEEPKGNMRPHVEKLDSKLQEIVDLIDVLKVDCDPNILPLLEKALNTPVKYARKQTSTMLKIL